MALTVIEQLKLLSGEVSPESTDLKSLVKQCSFKYAKSFYDNLKDTTASSLGASYASKMLNICRSVFSSQVGLNDNLTRLIVLIIGEAATNMAQVEGATDATWETFVYSQIDESFEYMAGVLAAEKEAYNLLP